MLHNSCDSRFKVIALGDQDDGLLFRETVITSLIVLVIVEVNNWSTYMHTEGAIRTMSKDWQDMTDATDCQEDEIFAMWTEE